MSLLLQYSTLSYFMNPFALTIFRAVSNIVSTDIISISLSIWLICSLLSINWLSCWFKLSISLSINSFSPLNPAFLLMPNSSASFHLIFFFLAISYRSSLTVVVMTCLPLRFGLAILSPPFIFTLYCSWFISLFLHLFRGRFVVVLCHTRSRLNSLSCFCVRVVSSTWLCHSWGMVGVCFWSQSSS